MKIISYQPRRHGKTQEWANMGYSERCKRQDNKTLYWWRHRTALTLDKIEELEWDMSPANRAYLEDTEQQMAAILNEISERKANNTWAEPHYPATEQEATDEQRAFLIGKGSLEMLLHRAVKTMRHKAGYEVQKAEDEFYTPLNEGSKEELKWRLAYRVHSTQQVRSMVVARCLHNWGKEGRMYITINNKKIYLDISY